MYKKLLEVPPGRVTTYGDLARAVGLHNGQRAIGRIMNKNPFPGLVPCHRVIKSDGTVGGYAHGAMIKENMLCVEGLRISGGKVEDLDSIRHRF